MADYYISDTVFDVALQYLKDNVTRLTVLAGDPGTVYADCNTANGTGSGLNIASKTVAATAFTIAAGATDGRKVTVDAQDDVAVTTLGDASHVSWLDVSGTEVLYTTKLTTVRTGLTTSDTVDIPAHFAAIRDAVVAS